MKIRRIPKDEPRGEECHSCHSRPTIEVDFGSKRPVLRVCSRCGRYLSGVIVNRIAEAEAGVPIPEPGTRPYR